MSRRTSTTDGAASPAHTIALVARREFTTRGRARPFMIGNAVMLVIIVAGIVAASVFAGGPADPQRVGLVGAARTLAAPVTQAGAALDTPVSTREVSDEASARSRVADGDLDVALVPGQGGGYTAITGESLSPELAGLLTTSVRNQAFDAALRDRGVSPGELDADVAGATVTVDALDPPEANAGQRLVLAYTALLLMFFQIFVFGLYVAMGVVEEKSSRVVEVLLATIKPLHLLWGKVLGIGAVGLLQLAVFGAVALVAAIGTGLVTVTGTAVAVFVSVLGWFVLAYVFFAVLYAAAGSLVSRQEDVNSAATPINMLVLIMYFLAQVTVSDPAGTLGSVMSWIPPFSAMLMPLRVAAGVTGPVQIVVTALTMLLVTVAMAVIAAGVYQRSVLRSGRRVGWKEALGRS